METARDSGDATLAESLLAFFIEKGDKEGFTACLYNCYELLKPDVVMELAWRNKMMDAAMPYMIQSMRNYTARIDALDKKDAQKEKEEDKKKSASNDFDPTAGMMGGGMPGMGMGHLAIGNAPGAGMMPGMGMGGMGMGGMPNGGMGGMGGF
jgi:clathrin heavy chain